MTDRLWSVVKADVTSAGHEHEDELNHWWSCEHVPLYVARDGFHRAWRLRGAEHESACGIAEPRFFAVYEIDSVDDFTSALREEQWGPFQRYVDDWIVGWTRTYYRMLSVYGNPGDGGGYWAVVKAEPEFTDDDTLAAFNRWYDEEHVPEICAAEGVHGAWRLEVLPHEGALGTAQHRFWATYRVDSPQHFADAVAARDAAGLERWGGVWGDRIRDWGVSFHEEILDVRATADPPGFVVIEHSQAGGGR